ncbi:MAG: MotA/TolQ/ExbB proton channel family protein [Myxococcota bacterium]|nr:MotA/TolQ/ExbB proton channel family protein [Myxococcota bacterium]
MIAPETALQSLSDYINEGGFVMPPLMAAAFILWYALGYRFLTLHRGFRGDLTRGLNRGRVPKSGLLGRAWDIVEAMPRQQQSVEQVDGLLREQFMPLNHRLNTYRILVRNIVILAPLAGLLGTVAGMIETFDALGDQALFASSGGVAGGISQALLTTQMGLVVAVPGLVVGRLLDRRQRRIEGDLLQLREWVSQQERTVSI